MFSAPCPSPVSDVTAPRIPTDYFRFMIFILTLSFLLIVCVCCLYYYETVKHYYYSSQTPQEDIEGGQLRVSRGLDDNAFREISWPAFIGNVHNCAICLEEPRYGDVYSVRPNCNHVYHKRCIDKWLTKDARCPLCRGYAWGPSAIINTARQNEAQASQGNA